MNSKKNKFLYGAIILTLSGIIAKVIGAFFRVPLISMIGSNGLGIFQLIFPIFSFFVIFLTGGVSLGLSKLISIELTNNNMANIKKILKSAIIIMLILSVIISTLFLLIAFPLSCLQGNKNFFICYLALVPAIILSSIICVLRGYFQGHQNMMPSGVSQIIEQSVKLCASLFFANFFLKFGVIFAVFGAFLGISISEAVVVFYLYSNYYLLQKKQSSTLSKQLQSDYTFKFCIKKILKTTIPIMLNSAIMPLVYAVESMIVIWLLSKANISSQLATSLFGLEDGIVTSLVNLPTVFAGAISTALMPSLTTDFNNNNTQGCKQKCTNAIKIAWLICLPCALAYIFLSKDIVLFLYKNGLNNTSYDELKVVVDLLKISSFNIIYVSILNITTSILQSINKSYVPVKNLGISAIIKLAVTFLLVSSKQFNIYGLVISDIVCFSVALILNLYQLKQYINIKFDVNNFVFKPILACLTMLLSIFSIKIAFSTFITNRILLILIVGFGLLIYITTLFLTKTITKEDIAILPKLKKRTN